MDEDWDDEQLAALDAAEAAVSSSSSSSRNDNDIASPQDIRDALQRAQSALATMRARNHAGASGRWCRCDTARLHFFHNNALTLIQRDNTTRGRGIFKNYKIGKEQATSENSALEYRK